MEQWLPRRPLILAPVIPLVWTVSWLCIVSARFLMGIRYPQPSQLQDSVLLVSALVLLVNIYNLILIYQRTDKYRNLPTYGPRAMLLAIILIVSIVLAWGQPQVVLIPNRLTRWVAVFIALNFIQALLGEFFTLLERPKTRRKLASLYFPTVVLGIAGIYIPLYLTLYNSWSTSLLIIGFILLTCFAFMSWQNLKGIFSKALATNSVIYEMFIGIHLVSVVLAVICGCCSIILYHQGSLTFIISSYCFVAGLIAYGITGLIIGAMQRYENDYRYGHVNGHPQRYILLGGMLMLSLLVVNYYFTK
ncbi:hypothetical protein H5S09_05705 [Limosilactobacillus sp. STM2_1]|uniref:Uncharacterized protein n=1 Tax=Limosilactobacillus rudii TaxID=2759755 RepID=A0A7W3UKZ5_9LACO|nr:hypothetical protein [Limosilactobacillus rudii]MBB1079385.1 hypothetical protein [Limosilactobacillus rudii]MBB1097431.1 hypothetical protein [Limosilactobacillus rudii]MCD7134540.1 hypothetical protein [Limosilactobacillus rudii]